jgi:hypothetical protein
LIFQNDAFGTNPNGAGISGEDPVEYSDRDPRKMRSTSIVMGYLALRMHKKTFCQKSKDNVFTDGTYSMCAARPPVVTV